MRRVLIIGAGNAGTTVANKLRRRLGTRDWTITVVDRSPVYLHQAGLLALPFGGAGSQHLLRPHGKRLRRGITLILGDAAQVVTHTHHVVLTDGRRIDFDYLVIATGAVPRPEWIPGLIGPQWRHSVHEYFSASGAIALRGGVHRLASTGGRLVLYADGSSPGDLSTPLAFLAKADAYLRYRNVRDTVELVCATPMDTASSPVAAARLDTTLEQHKIVLESGFAVSRVDHDRSAIVAADGRQTPFDLLVASPLRTGADVVGRSGLGNGQGYVEVHPETLRSRTHADIFAIGSAAEPSGTATPNISAAAFADTFARLAHGLPPVQAPDRWHIPDWLRHR